MTPNAKNTTMILMGLAVLATGGTFSAMQFIAAESAPLEDESSGIRGHIEVVATDENGNIKSYQQTDNIIVDVANDAIVDEMFSPNTALGSATTADFDFIEIDIGTAAPASTDTGMGGTATCARVQDATVTGSTATAGESTVTVDATFSGSAAGCNITVTESGLWNTSTAASTLFAKQTFSSVALGTGDSLTVTWSINFT